MCSSDLVGATLGDGFGMIAEAVELYDRIEEADLVVTGEGRLDATSFTGKVVGGVAELARAAGVPVLAVVGRADADMTTGLPFVDLSREFGEHRATTAPTACVTEAVRRWIATSAGTLGVDDPGADTDDDDQQ